jgi:hypothetical protein
VKKTRKDPAAEMLRDFFVLATGFWLLATGCWYLLIQVP